MTEPSEKRSNHQPLCSKVIIQNPRGLHMRAAAAVAKVAMKFRSTVTVRKQERAVSGKSWLNLMTLAAPPGAELTIEVDGDDAHEALPLLVAVLSSPGAEEIAAQ